jgi:hypothetical protein
MYIYSKYTNTLSITLDPVNLRILTRVPPGAKRPRFHSYLYIVGRTVLCMTNPKKIACIHPAD